MVRQAEVMCERDREEVKLQDKVWGTMGSEGSQEELRWRKKYEMEGEGDGRWWKGQ